MKNIEIEKLSKDFSFKLAKKLEEKKITIEEMAYIINDFFVLLNKTNNIKKIKEFVDKF
jgi:hypothetical protein